MFDRTLPSEEFFDRQQIAAAGLFERQEPAANGCYDLGLAMNHPARRPWWREIGNCQRGAVGSADILPWAVFGHVVIARKEPMPKSYTLEFKSSPRKNLQSDAPRMVAGAGAFALDPATQTRVQKLSATCVLLST